MQYRIFYTFFLGASLSVLISACSSKAADEPAAGKASAPANLPVDVIVAESRPEQLAEILAGSLLPAREVAISGEMTRRISEVAFQDGSHIQAGQVLYRLDDRDIRARLKQLDAELHLASITERRMRNLLATETVRPEEYDAALAKLQVLEASRDGLQVELSKTVIRSPFAGVAGITKVQAGALITPGMPLVILQEQSQVRVQFTVPEKYVSILKKGNLVTFTTEGEKGEHQARIIATEPGIDPLSRNITVQAVAANPSGRLRPGMSARVYFTAKGTHAGVIALPTQALLPSAEGYSVFVVKNGLARMAPVTISYRSEETATITAGVNPGDTVMISNTLRAMDGTPVHIVTKK